MRLRGEVTHRVPERAHGVPGCPQARVLRDVGSCHPSFATCGFNHFLEASSPPERGGEADVRDRVTQGSGAGLSSPTARWPAMLQALSWIAGIKEKKVKTKNLVSHRRKVLQ